MTPTPGANHPVAGGDLTRRDRDAQGAGAPADVSAETATVAAPRSDPGLVADPTYRRLLGPDAWRRLPQEVQRRFSSRPHGDAHVSYRGHVRIRMSPAGRLFAQVCRVLGTLLPPRAGLSVPVNVDLTDDADGGVRWTRRYEYPRSKPVTVASTKCIGAGGRLLEMVGRFFVMDLDVTEQDGSLVFTSTAYRLRLGGLRLKIPDALTPGTTTVAHTQVAGDLFRFTLRVHHRWLGETLLQEGLFQGFMTSRIAARYRQRQRSIS